MLLVSAVVEIELICCSGVWLETQYAYYVLGDAHPDYQECYSKFDSWVQTTHRLVNLARTTPSLALDEILKEISLRGDAGSDDRFTENELRDTVSLLRSCQELLRSLSRLKRCFLMSTLMAMKHRLRLGTPGMSVCMIWGTCGIPLHSSTCGNGLNAVHTSFRKLQKRPMHRLRPSLLHSLTGLLDPSSKVLLRVDSSRLPVCRIGLNFLAHAFIRNIRLVSLSQGWSIIDPGYRQGHLFCMKEIKRFCKLKCESKDTAHILFNRPSVVVKVVRPGVIINHSNLNGVHLVHVLRLEHASCTPMGELAHPQELVLVPHCDDVSMDKLRGLLAVESIGAAVEPPTRGRSFFLRYVRSSGGPDRASFSYRYLYDFIEDHTLLDLDPLWTSNRTCLACSYDSTSRKDNCDYELWHHFSKQAPSLAAFDAFAGAGGLSTGLMKSGATTCKYAVEIEESAARTFQ